MSKYKPRTEAQKARRRELAAQKRAAAKTVKTPPKAWKTPPKACKSCTEKCAKAKKAVKTAPAVKRVEGMVIPRHIVIELESGAIAADSVQIYEKFMNAVVKSVGNEVARLLNAFDDAIAFASAKMAEKKTAKK